MKLKKVIINGKEYYTSDETDANVIDVDVDMNIDNDNKYVRKIKVKLQKYLSKVDDEHQDVKKEMVEIVNDFIDEIDDMDDDEDIYDEYDDCLNDLDDCYEEYKDDLDNEEDENEEKEEKEGIKENINKSENKISILLPNLFGKKNKKYKEYSFSFGKSKATSKKTSKLFSILPFMNKNEIHEILMELLDDPKTFDDLDIVSLMPFISSEDADMLFEKALEGNKKINIFSVIPFISQKKLSLIVDKYINGEYQDLNINSLYPFLSKEDLRRLFDYIIKTKD